MHFRYNGWELDIDQVKTSLYYQNLTNGGCPDCCAYCRNFCHGVERAPAALPDFLRALGIDPRRAAHVTWMGRRETGGQLYAASYLLTGAVLGRPEGSVSGSRGGLVCTRYTSLCEGAFFHFSGDLCLPGGVRRCPEPALQLDVFCELPWVIGEAPPERKT